ncbi:MAG: DUF2752 domain-containing protein, partial [Planctomycetota bacterium]
RQRKIAGLVFVVIAGFFVSLYPAAVGKIDIGLWLGPCGFKQRYGLPCPTCGMTTSVLAFVRGDVFESFRVQPTAGLMCSMLAVTAFFAFLIAASGVYFRGLNRFFGELKMRYVILSLAVIIGGGWMVTLTRALAER